MAGYYRTFVTITVGLKVKKAVGFRKKKTKSDRVIEKKTNGEKKNRYNCMVQIVGKPLVTSATFRGVMLFTPVCLLVC